jgi:hypothetical protein
MGRPPIGKVAMTAAERLRRHRLKHRPEQKPGENAALARAYERMAELEREVARLKAAPVTKPSADDTTPLKARIRDLEAEVARLRAAATAQRRPESRGTAVEEDTKLKKLIRLLDSPQKEEAAGALRKLAGELQARGRGFQELADLTAQWDQEDAAVRPPKLKPIDWPEVERAIKTYAEGKTKVTMNKVISAVQAQVPAFEGYRKDVPSQTKVGFIHKCLRGLGFTASRSGLTYERAAPRN